MNEQLDLLSAPSLVEAVQAPTPGRVHQHGLTTEKQAAAKVSFRSGSQKSLLLVELARRGEAIPHDLAPIAGCAYPHVATTRLADLEELGLVERTTLSGRTPTGDEALVWRITAEGVRVASELRRAA